MKHYIPEAGIVVDDSDNSLAYFLLGLGLGAVAGILFAPQSGEETRKMLKDRANEGADYVRRRGEELRESAEEAIDRGKQSLNRQKESLKTAVEAGRQAYREAATGDSE